MDKQEVYEKVVAVISELFDIDRSRLTLDARFQDLELTSIDAIDMVVELQRITGKRVGEAGLRQVRTIGDVVDLVHTLVSQPTPQA